MRTILLLAAVAAALAACGQEPSYIDAQPLPADVLASEAAADAEAAAAAPVEPPASTFERSETYRPYQLVAMAGEPVTGDSFERIMCKPGIAEIAFMTDVFQRTVYFQPDDSVTVWAATSDGRSVQMTLISDNHVPKFLLMGSEMVGSCN